MNHSTLYVYPCYIDFNFKLDEGRKISKEKSVENPTYQEIAQATTDLGFKIDIQPTKRHPKDFYRFGRVVVTFYVESETDKNKFPLNPHIHKRKDLYIQIAQRIK